MLLLLPLVALAAHGAPTPDDGRALDWLWRDLSLGQYPQVNRAGLEAASVGVEPLEELLEEGRRRTDKTKAVKKKPSKGLRDQDTDVVATGSAEQHRDDSTSQIIQTVAIPEKPILLPVLPTIQKPESLLVPVNTKSSYSVWSWFKNLFPSVWWPTSLTVATPQVSLSNLAPQLSTLKPQGILTNPIPQFSLFKPQVSLSNLVPQFSAWIPTKAPVVEKPVHVPVPPAYRPVPAPSKSEVMVLRYPEFIRTIGKGISKVSNAVKNFGQNVSQSLANKIKLQSVPTKIGAGVAAIIPLKDETDIQQNHGTVSVPFPSIQKPIFGSGLNLGSLFNKGSGVSVSGSASGTLSVSNTGSHANVGAQHSQTKSVV